MYQAGVITFKMQETIKSVFSRLQAVESLSCAHPKHSILIFCNGSDIGVADGVWILRVVLIDNRFIVLGVEANEATGRGTDPITAATVLIDCGNVLCGGLLIGGGIVVLECIARSIKQVKPAHGA